MPVTLGSWDEQGLTLERELVPSGFDTHLSLVPFADKIETWHGAQVNKQTKQTCAMLLHCGSEIMQGELQVLKSGERMNSFV